LRSGTGKHEQPGRAGLAGLACLPGLVAAQALAQGCPDAPAAGEATSSYAFASELGSGVYDLGGRTLQVYRLPLGHTLRVAAPGRYGQRVTLPVTIGIFDFKSQDVLQGVVPSRIDRLSFAPGIELEFLPDAHWSLRPYMQAGVSSASVTAVDAAIFGTGLRADYRWQAAGGAGLVAHQLNYTAVNYRGCFPNDRLLRARSGIEWRRDTGRRLHGRGIEAGAFAVGDWFIEPPHSPIAGRPVVSLQGEIGLMLGLRPMPTVFGFTAPRLGLSYRFAGELSGWRLVIGAPL
jgi:hypothetical protein